jgi:hypothetical protein
MFENETRVLLILPQEILDRARVLAGKTTTVLKLPVSLQIVLRALLVVGLRRENHAALLGSVESQALAVSDRRRRSGGRAGSRRPPGTAAGARGSSQRSR